MRGMHESVSYVERWTESGTRGKLDEVEGLGGDDSTRPNGHSARHHQQTICTLYNIPHMSHDAIRKVCVAQISHVLNA